MSSLSSLTVFFIVLFILMYYRFDKRIRLLEKKISELSEKTPSPVTEVMHESNREVSGYTADIQNPDVISADPEESDAQKDWLAPVFDFIKHNALTIVGIFTLVLGIGYFVKYAVDKNWIGETSRAGIGFTIGMLIIGSSHFLRKNYAVFASIITGGGVAVLYFTATIAFREYHLFSQNTAFIITCLVTILSTALSYYYKSEILLIFSLFGGFLAPLMISSGQSNYIFLFTYLSVLNFGMLIVAYLKHWKSIGWISFIFTSIYFFFWTVENPAGAAIPFYVAAYLLFYSFALQNYIRKKRLQQLDILMLVLINFSCVAGLVYIFNELHYFPVSVFPFVFAVLNSIGWYREYENKKFSTNYSVFTSITISLITLALAIELKTHLITTVWAIEATVLLFIWRKTRHKIFKSFYYILFPLVILSQIITWAGYFNSGSLNVIFNPVFMTSLVVITSCLLNLFLLKNDDHEINPDSDFYENIFKILCFAVIYFSVLFEVIYHISAESFTFILTVGLLFTLFYIFILIILSEKLLISEKFKTGLICFFLLLILVHVSSSQIVSEIVSKKTDSSFFLVYLLYIFPLLYTVIKILPKSDFIRRHLSYWLIAAVIIAAFSFELFRMYIFLNARSANDIYSLQDHFCILYLPIIWAVLACLFIYFGLKRGISEFNKIGFSLLGVMILKLYVYDVWQMDHVSRIIAFILLGIILLLSSFMFQRLKMLIRNFVETKGKNADDSEHK